jgi:flagellar export protein FliJ
MSRFKFRLQRVLELREEAERARAIALTAAQDSATAARSARDAIDSAREAGRQTLAQASSTGMQVGTLQQMQLVLGALDSRLLSADGAVVTAESLVRRAQDELRAAFQARQALDTLREKQHETHRQAEVMADRTLMDEIALTRFQSADSTPPEPERTSNA